MRKLQQSSSSSLGMLLIRPFLIISLQVLSSSTTKATTTSIPAMSQSWPQNASIGWKPVISAASTAWTPFRLKLKRRTISSSSWSKRRMCHTSGPRDACVISMVGSEAPSIHEHLSIFSFINQVVRAARTCSRRTSTDGSGQQIARRFNQQTATQLAGDTIHGLKLDTRRFHSPTTPNSTSTKPQSHACRFSTTSITTALHGWVHRKVFYLFFYLNRQPLVILISYARQFSPLFSMMLVSWHGLTLLHCLSAFLIRLSFHSLLPWEAVHLRGLWRAFELHCRHKPWPETVKLLPSSHQLSSKSIRKLLQCLCKKINDLTVSSTNYPPFVSNHLFLRNLFVKPSPKSSELFFSSFSWSCYFSLFFYVMFFFTFFNLLLNEKRLSLPRKTMFRENEMKGINIKWRVS